VTYQYVASDRIIDKQIIENLSRIMSLAGSFKCELRLAQDEASQKTDEGYMKLRCVVKVLSKDSLDAFTKAATQQTDFGNCFTISESYFSKSFDFIDLFDNSPLAFNSWVDTLLEIADANSRLSQRRHGD
jgi:hypothetical protein